MKNKLHDFLAGFITPFFAEKVLSPKCFDWVFWIDSFALVVISCVSGIFVAMTKDFIFRKYKQIWRPKNES